MANFDFEKRTLASPYTVPEDFFEQMEDRLAMRAASIRFPQTHLMTRRLRYAAAAAVVALVIGTAALYDSPASSPENFDEIARLFQQLSPDDQNSMLESYQDDIFMNE